jgi:hypothetical protein
MSSVKGTGDYQKPGTSKTEKKVRKELWGRKTKHIQ